MWLNLTFDVFCLLFGSLMEIRLKEKYLVFNCQLLMFEHGAEALEWLLRILIYIDRVIVY